jgi:single-strand DNA-binding protein
MQSVNRVTILGFLGKSPEIRTLESGNKVASFSVATSEKYKNKAGELVEETTWHNIVIWGKLADIVEKYLVKGSQVYLEGSIKNRSYEKDGVTKYITEINCEKMVMLGGKSKEAQGEQPDQNDLKSGDKDGNGLDGDPTNEMPF